MLFRLASKFALIAITALLLTGCGAADRLANIGKAPSLTSIDDPTAAPGYKPVSLPMPPPEQPVYQANVYEREL